MKWLFLIVALAVTTAGVAFAGPMWIDGCETGPHPGIVAERHWEDDRTIPPVWGCRYFTPGGDVWRDERFGALYGAVGVAALLLVLIVVFRRRPPPALQGLVVAWLTVAVYGALASYAVEAAWAATTVVAVPCIAFDLRRPRPGLLRWWWAAGVTLLVWAALVFAPLLGEQANPWLPLALGAVLGAVAPRFAKYPPDP